MAEFDRIRVAAELAAMNSDYWYQVDHCWGETAHDFFEATGSFGIGDRLFSGQDEIREFYSWRKGRGARTVRHVVTNFHLTLSTSDRVLSTSILCIYAADGVPVLPTHPPIQLSDLNDECIRGADGRWRYRSRRIVPLFEGGIPVTIPPTSGR